MSGAWIVRMKLFAIFAAAGVLSAAAPVAPAANDLPALANLESGQWALVSRENPSASRKLCVADPRTLLQLEHRNANCSRYVIANGPREVTVHYKCPGQGHGRTTIRVESPRLAQIETQGIAGGSPFSESFEGRRAGECPEVTGMLPR
jgi:hypothetical protein